MYTRACVPRTTAILQPELKENFKRTRDIYIKADAVAFSELRFTIRI